MYFAFLCYHKLVNKDLYIITQRESPPKEGGQLSQYLAGRVCGEAGDVC